MKLCLRSNERFNHLVWFDPAIQAVTPLDPDTPAPDVSGLFGVAGAHSLLLYKLDDRLMLHAGGKTIPITPEAAAEIKAQDDAQTLIVTVGGTEALRLDYRPEPGIENDPTPFVDDEDEDFALFVANIISAPPRQEVLLDIWA